MGKTSSRKRVYECGPKLTKNKKEKIEKMAVDKSVPYLPNETWLAVFAWIERMELGQRVSFACSRFSALANARLHERTLAKPRDNLLCMRGLLFDFELGFGKHLFSPVIKRGPNRIEWAEGPLPDNIVAMESIEIRFFDSTVFAFLKRIRSLLATAELHLHFCSMSQENRLAMQHILPMCGGPILSIQLSARDFAEFSTNFTQPLAKCRLLDVWGTPNAAIEYLNGIPKLVDWLTDERNGNGQPKLLRIFFWDVSQTNAFIDQIKQNFLASNRPAPFFVRMLLYDAGVFCELNGRTGEQLTLSKIHADEDDDGDEDEDGGWGLLSRGPIGGADPQSEMAKARDQLIAYTPANVANCKGRLDFGVTQLGDLDGLDSDDKDE